VVVAKQQAVGAGGLTVRATFQPCRTAELCLARAYDRLLPIGRASLKTSSPNRGLQQEGSNDQDASSNLRAGEFGTTSRVQHDRQSGGCVARAGSGRRT